MLGLAHMMWGHVRQANAKQRRGRAGTTGANRMPPMSGQEFGNSSHQGFKDDWPKSLLVILGSLYNIYPERGIRHNATNQSTQKTRFKAVKFLFSGRVKPGVCYHLVKLGRPSEFSGGVVLSCCYLSVVELFKMTSARISYLSFSDMTIYELKSSLPSNSGRFHGKRASFIAPSYEECASMAKNGGL